MQRALAAARAVRGRTSPNPWVGAVLVRDGSVVAEGATSPDGGPHAEAGALTGGERGGTLYVTLEPCAPFPGKRTQPCAEAIIEAGIERVVVALLDAEPGFAAGGWRCCGRRASRWTWATGRRRLWRCCGRT